MGSLGVHFAVTQGTVDQFLAADGDDRAVMELLEALEEGDLPNDPQFSQDTDKAWDAIHRCLSDGSLRPEGGTAPLNRCVLGGRSLYDANDYIITLVTPEEVREVATALAPIDAAWMRGRYKSLEATHYRAFMNPQDFEYTWDWFAELKDFYRRAAEGGYSVLFTASQ
jgi:hypothetical protein